MEKSQTNATNVSLPLLRPKGCQWQKETDIFLMLITFEGEVPQRSDASQNDHKSKGYPSKTSEAAFTMQKADKGDLRRLARLPLK